MRRASHTRERDEGGLTAVIEFLSAFTLFLMILTAFLSLAQLQMGSNDPDVDRLDRAASLGLDRLTSGEGWFVPMAGDLDYENATSDWHLADAEALDAGRVQPGLMANHKLDMNRISALHNVTEDGMAAGLGLDSDMSLHLSIRVLESDAPAREGLVLFDGGTERGTAPSSSTAYRSFQQDGEQISVVLEVHDGGRKNNILHITEVMVRPSSAGPEWIELHNPNDFAIALRGWSFNHTSGSTSSNLLLQSGVVAGQSLSVLTGDPSSQAVGSASHVIDLGALGFLGVGQIDGLADGRGLLSLRYTQLDEITPADVVRVEWGGDTQLFMVTGQSLVWDGTDRFSSSAWSLEDAPTPGEYGA
ncbi:MAG: lamin tail domain-containing protein [Poseidonia sp.]